MPTLYELELLENLDEHALLRPKDAARLLAVNTRTLSIWADKGKIRYVMTQGGHRRYPLSVVRALMDGKNQDAVELPENYDC
jgi:excisionase family DNA binding protein